MAQSEKTFFSKPLGAGAGVAGFLGFTALFTVSAVLYVTENYFGSLFCISLALLLYVAGRDTMRIFLSAFTVFFSSRHVIAKANYIQETLNPLRKQLALSGAEKTATPALLGANILLPNNPLAQDIQKLLQTNKGFDAIEYVTHSYYIECHELYDNASANLDFIAVSMPVFGLIGTVLGLMAMFDNLGGEISVDTLSPQLAMALKTTLYGAFFSALYKILCSRYERRIRNLDYDYETLCRGLQVVSENKIKVELAP